VPILARQIMRDMTPAAVGQLAYCGKEAQGGACRAPARCVRRTAARPASHLTLQPWM